MVCLIIAGFLNLVDLKKYDIPVGVIVAVRPMNGMFGKASRRTPILA